MLLFFKNTYHREGWIECLKGLIRMRSKHEASFGKLGGGQKRAKPRKFLIFLFIFSVVARMKKLGRVNWINVSLFWKNIEFFLVQIAWKYIIWRKVGGNWPTPCPVSCYGPDIIIFLIKNHLIISILATKNPTYA